MTTNALRRRGADPRILAALLGAILGTAPLPAAVAGTSDDTTTPTAAERLQVEDPYDTTALPRRVRKEVFLSSAYAKRGDYEQAADVLLRFLAEHPDEDHYLVRLHLAQHLSDLGRTAEALEQYRRAIELQPGLDRGWMGLGDAAYDLERYEVAGEAFLAGYECSTERRPEVLYYAAASYLMAEEPDKALPIFEDLVTRYGGRADLKWYQGLVISALGAGRARAGRRRGRSAADGHSRRSGSLVPEVPARGGPARFPHRGHLPDVWWATCATSRRRSASSWATCTAWATCPGWPAASTSTRSRPWATRPTAATGSGWSRPWSRPTKPTRPSRRWTRPWPRPRPAVWWPCWAMSTTCATSTPRPWAPTPAWPTWARTPAGPG